MVAQAAMKPTIFTDSMLDVSWAQRSRRSLTNADFFRTAGHCSQPVVADPAAEDHRNARRADGVDTRESRTP